MNNGAELRVRAVLLRVRVRAPAIIFPVLSQRYVPHQAVLKEG